MIISAPTEKLLTIAFRAIEAQKAAEETRAAKNHYHTAWKAFEAGDDYDPGADYFYMIDNDDRIGANNPLFQEACAATKQWHDAYKAAKRAEYNAKRRLETAIRRIA